MVDVWLQTSAGAWPVCVSKNTVSFAVCSYLHFVTFAILFVVQAETFRGFYVLH